MQFEHMLRFIVSAVCFVSISDALECLNCNFCEGGDLTTVACHPPYDKSCAKNVMKKADTGIEFIHRGCSQMDFEGDSQKRCPPRAGLEMSVPLCLYLCKTNKCNSAGVLLPNKVALVSSISFLALWTFVPLHQS